nr:hypothetical protein CFP56_38965 [Quercus suber]
MEILNYFYESLTSQEKLDVIIRRRRAHGQEFAVPRPGDLRYSPGLGCSDILRYWDEVRAEDVDGVRRQAIRLMAEECRLEDQELETWLDQCIRTDTYLGIRHVTAFHNQNQIAAGSVASIHAGAYAELTLQHRRYSNALLSITTEESGYDGDNECGRAGRARLENASE